MPVRARIATLERLSAHADCKELLGWMRAIPDVRRVALHDGDVEAQQAFAAWAQRSCSARRLFFATTAGGGRPGGETLASKESRMNSSFFVVALLSASSLLYACGSDSEKTGDGKSSSGGSNTSGGSTTSGGSSSEQTCQSSSLNGQCTAGPAKGSSCCYAPSSADDPPCASSKECSTVCRYCQ